MLLFRRSRSQNLNLAAKSKQLDVHQLPATSRAIFLIASTTCTASSREA